MRTNPQQTLTPLALVVLRLLRRRPMHPYEMQHMIRELAIDRVVKVRPGSLYHTVERLHRLDLIQPVETGREGRRPERTVYAITEAGRDEFAANLRELLREPKDEFPVFAAAIEMVRALEPDEVVRLLERRVIALEAGVAAAEQVAASLVKGGLPRLAAIEVEYCRVLRQAELTFVRQMIEDIRSGALPWTRDNEELPE